MNIVSHSNTYGTKKYTLRQIFGNSAHNRSQLEEHLYHAAPNIWWQYPESTLY